MASGVSVWALRELHKGLSVTEGFGVKHWVITLFVPWFPWVGSSPEDLTHENIPGRSRRKAWREKKGRTAQTAGWGGKGANGRDSGSGLLLIIVLVGVWEGLCWELLFLCLFCESSSFALPVLLLQEWREKVPCGNRQIYDGNIRDACALWGCCWRVLLSYFCYKQGAAGLEGTLNCLIWPPAPRLGQIYLNFPSRCLSKAVVKSLQWWTFLILPGWSLKVSAITKIFLVSDFDFCAAVENCCPLALLFLYRVSCSVLWSCLWESLGCVFLEFQGPTLAWSALSDTCVYWATNTI